MPNDDEILEPEGHYVDIQCASFIVLDKPYCVWDRDIEGISRSFLEGVAPAYFEYLANANLDAALDEALNERTMFASLTIRAAYSQALETLFALLGAAIQAPLCVPAWLALYKVQDLRDIVSKIGNQDPLATVLEVDGPSWQDISEFVHSAIALDDEEKRARIVADYATLWARFASDFVNSDFAAEYNSIKHGLRFRTGGFHISFGRENKSSEAAPTDRMELAGKSDYGSRYYQVEKLLETNHHHRLRRHHRNWHPEDFAYGLLLISRSIQNIISTLRILNGASPEDASYIWPTEEEINQEPWKRVIQIGVTSMSGPHYDVPEELIMPYSEDQIRSRYLEGKYLVTIRHQFTEE